jgi:hypothetical protein
MALKPRFSRQIKKGEDLTQHIQQLTDDVAKTMTDGIPSDSRYQKLYTTTALSRNAVSLPKNSQDKAPVGAAVIFVSDGATVSSTIWSRVGSDLTVTLIFTDNASHEVSYMCYYGE